MEIQSVNWCSKHRIQFSCDHPCPQCSDALKRFIDEYKKWLAAPPSTTMFGTALALVVLTDRLYNSETES